MIERVAKAMRECASAERDEDSDFLAEFGGYADDADFLSIARAAIEAMREPTWAMVIAAELPIFGAVSPDYDDGYCVDRREIPSIWQAMIDTALAQRTEGE